jgi:latent transforming growth factor beta binding protein
VCGLTDVDECEGPQSSCRGGECKNTEGSYQCLCHQGFQLVNGTMCEGEYPSLLSGAGDSECLAEVKASLETRPSHLAPADVNECVGEEHCAPHGECLNSLGSFFCLCAPGFASAEGGTRCQGKKSAWSCLRSTSRTGF